MPKLTLALAFLNVSVTVNPPVKYNYCFFQTFYKKAERNSEEHSYYFFKFRYQITVFTCIAVTETNSF